MDKRIDKVFSKYLKASASSSAGLEFLKNLKKDSKSTAERAKINPQANG